MTREGTRLIAAVVTAVLAAALLGACGGSDSTTTTSASTSEETGPQTGSTGSTGGSGSKDGQGKARSKQAGGSGSGKASGSGESSNFTPEPLRVSGGGSSQFRQKGGDNSIQDFGDEAGESELTEAAEALHGYLVARAQEDWSKSCSYLSKSELQQLEQLASQSPQLKNGGCPAIIEALGGEPLSNATRRELTEVDAASLRTEGEQSFLIYRGTGSTGFFMGMVNEDGAWKVTALAPTAFP